MKITYRLTGKERRSLVDAISQELQSPILYLAAPSFAYQVGGYHIDKDGTITGEDNLDLEDALHQRGFEAKEREYSQPDTYESGLGGMGALDEFPDIDQHHPGQYANPDAPITEAMQNEVIAFEDLQLDGREELGLGRTRREDFQGENGMQASDVPDFSNSGDSFPLFEDFHYVDDNVPNPDTLVIEVPITGFTPKKHDNLTKLVESKQTLLTKALGGPLTVNDTGETLQFIYPYSENNGAEIIYSQLTTALIEYVKNHKRVTTKEREVEREKFAFRTFLVRLGMNGPEFGAARKWLCRNLSGNASFPRETSYDAMQASRRNGGQTDDEQ